MSFANYNNVNLKKNEDKKDKVVVNVPKNIFNEALNFLDKSWYKWNDDITKLKRDSLSLQKMYNDYDKNQTFLQLREELVKRIEQKKKFLFELEQLVLRVKTSIESSIDL